MFDVKGTNFNGLEKQEDLIALDNYLADKSYISGYNISQDDVLVTRRLEQLLIDPKMKIVLNISSLR